MFFVGWMCIKCAMKITSLSKPILIAIVVALVFTGTYAYSGEIFSMYVTLICGIIGLVFRYFKVPSAAIVLGFVLGKIMEANLRRGLIISRGSFMGCFTNSTLSSVLLVLSIISIFYSLKTNLKKKKPI